MKGKSMPVNTGVAALVSVAILSLVGFAPDILAQDFFTIPGSLVELNMKHSLSVFHPGAAGYIAITAEIAEGWHINSNKPLDSYLIPSVLEIEAPKGIVIERVIYPEPRLRKLAISDSKMSLYDGTVIFGVIFRVGKDTETGLYPLRAKLSYQGCNDMACIEPASAVATDTIRVGAMEEQVEELSPEIFSRPPFVDGTSQSAASSIRELKKGTPDLSSLLRDRGIVLTFVMIFLAGLALNLTPCIYPIIPVTISYFGGQAAGKGGRIVVLAITYVLGMSITYSVIGTVAAMTGNLFGAALQNPFVIAGISAILLALALSMFGLWEIRLPGFLATSTGKAKTGYLGALFMGLTMGLVAAPCIGPFVLGLLTYVGQTANPLLGFLMFFTLAWGMGSPFVVLASVSGAVARLPRSGHWMVWVRKIFGFVLIAMAVYFLRTLTGERIALLLYSGTLVAAGISLSLLDRTPAQGKTFKAAKRIVLAASLVAAAAILVAAFKVGPQTNLVSIPWMPFTEDRLESAAREGKPVLLDFTAAWCVPCHELDRKTFSDRAVVDLARSVMPLRIDLTRTGETEKELKNRFSVRGVPTVIFIDSSGKEREELRITGYVGPREFERRLSELVMAGTR